jgi:dephospho-CoA kinase
MFALHGAHVLSADQIGREMMQPGERVYAAIVEQFGPAAVAADGTLDRAELARIAFADGRVDELNAIVHPAVIARQAELAAEIAAREPDAVAMIESALIFETKYGEMNYGGQGGWHKRFDRIILVCAREELKIARFVARASGSMSREALETDARRRLARQIGDDAKAGNCDYVLTNNGTLAELQAEVDALWPTLKAQAIGHFSS